MSTALIDKLARTGQCNHSIVTDFPVYQQGGVDCYCGIYATLNLISFIREYGPQPRRALSKTELKNIRGQFHALHESLGLFGGPGSEGYQLLPAAGAAFYEAGFEDVRLSLREFIRATTQKKLPDQWKQSEKEEKLPARIGIALQQDLRPESGRTLALAAVYECKKNGINTWEVSDEDELGHWVAIVGKGYISKAYGKSLREYNGIVLDSNRGYEVWKLDGQSALRLNRAGDPSEIRVWVYSLITIQIDESS